MHLLVVFSEILNIKIKLSVVIFETLIFYFSKKGLLSFFFSLQFSSRLERS